MCWVVLDWARRQRGVQRTCRCMGGSRSSLARLDGHCRARVKKVGRQAGRQAAGIEGEVVVGASKPASWLTTTRCRRVFGSTNGSAGLAGFLDGPAVRLRVGWGTGQPAVQLRVGQGTGQPAVQLWVDWGTGHDAHPTTQLTVKTAVATTPPLNIRSPPPCHIPYALGSEFFF